MLTLLCSMLTKHSTTQRDIMSRSHFIVIFDPQNMGLDNFNNKISQILSEILTNSVFSVMAAVIGFLPILSSRFARLCT